MTKDEFILECSKLGIDITEELYNKLYLYFKLLVEWNEKFNLTSILDEKSVFLKHFYDSLTIVKTSLIKTGTSLCDFGTGAGFPGLVVAIALDDVNVTLIESSKKKCEFLNYIIKELELKNASVLCERVEKFAEDNREVFDIVTCRAVSSLSVIIELGGALAQVNGYMILFKSSYEEELLKSRDIIDKMGFILEKVVSFKLPDGISERNILVFKKKEKTPSLYPRSYSTIVKTNKS